MTLKDTQCQGGCGKVRSILCSDSPADWLCNDCRTKKIPTFVDTTWELRTYDVWGNAKDGFEVNDTRSAGEVSIRCRVEVNNAGTPQEFLSAFPSDSQIRRALSLRRFKIETDGDDLRIYVNRARDGYPCGEMHCTSHDSLSPIRGNAQWEVIVGNIGSVYAGNDEGNARRKFDSYVKDSVNDYGRAAGENVTLMRDNEIVSEHIGTIATKEEN